MSDFIVSIGKKCTGDDLMDPLKRPYGERAPEGRSFDFPWGSVAVLKEHLTDNNNIIEKNGIVFAWVGDLITDLQDDFQKLFVHRLNQLQRCANKECISLKTDEMFRKLNGAFAILAADDTGFSIVTDPVSFVPVYMGVDSCGDALAFGTHPDSVSSISQNIHNIDFVSISDFLNSGMCTFPYTMYTNVKMIKPGTAHIVQISVSNKPNVKNYIYWTPPEELRQGYDEDELAEELQNALISAVKDRCHGQKVGVLLSGGLDSRVVMAAVPKSVDCIGLTFCNAPNRETRIASRVAQCYDRKWHLLIRDEEFLANSIVDTVKLIGCELDWVNAQMGALADQISKFEVSYVLGGVGLDFYLRGISAIDWFSEKQGKGLLPSRFRRKRYDYFDNISEFWKKNLKDELINKLHTRIKNRCENDGDLTRGSSAEFLSLYPFSEIGMASYWIADRRRLCMRPPTTDRRVLNFAFKCPVELKLGSRIFQKATRDLLGKGIYIPNANNGVRPCSGHCWRLVQRAIRKSQDRMTKILEKLGKEPQVQHSWHDYQKYWRESHKMKQLIGQHGSNLEELDGILFKESGQELLTRNDLHWQDGFRLLQLAVWKGLVKDYKPRK